MGAYWQRLLAPLVTNASDQKRKLNTSNLEIRMRQLSILSLLLLLSSTLPAKAQQGRTVYKTLQVSGQTLPYAVHLPDGFERNKTYPVLIGPGEAVSGEDPGFYWASDPYSHDWIIVDTHLWKAETTNVLDALLDQLNEDYNVEGEKFHTVCWSANSAGIFKLTMAHADRFHSITGMAGNPSRLSQHDIDALAKVRVQFVVGDQDPYWMRSAKTAHEALSAGGVVSSIEIIPNGEHVMTNLIGKGFMQRMEKMRVDG